MLDILFTILFCWLFFKAMGIAFHVAWGTAKLIASLLFIVALPMLVLMLIFAGGLLLLVPVIMVTIAWAILKDCV
jgi:hypothetical protein